jgi:GNAT superfamily N-acetyltransferase
MLLALPDGTPVLVRPIRAEDKCLLSSGLKQLSLDSAFKRFLSPKTSFSSAELRYLTEIDGRDHIALVAVHADDPAQLMGVVRCVRTQPGPSAELAIVIGDPWQRLGLGHRLVTELARYARRQGITRFTGTMLADNRPAFRLMRGFGAGFEAGPVSGGLREVVTRLVA